MVTPEEVTPEACGGVQRDMAYEYTYLLLAGQVRRALLFSAYFNPWCLPRHLEAPHDANPRAISG